MFKAAKDALTSRAAQTWANNLIARYVKLQDVKIDTTRQTVEATCLLNGEVSSITVGLDYTIENEAGKRFIRGRNFTATRPWLQVFLNDHAPEQRVELPPWAAAAL